MKENGWVCETYDEFRQHYPVPTTKKAGYHNDYTGETITFQQQERYMQTLWEDLKDKIVNRDGIIFPAVDIRNLKVLSYCNGGYDGMLHDDYDAINNISTIYENYKYEDEAEAHKRGMTEWIAEAPDEILKALGELHDYYDGETKYGEVIFHPENLK